MQRDGHDEVGVGKHVPPRRRHPARQQGEAVAPALMLERENEIAGDLPVDESGARPVVDGGPRDAGAAKLSGLDRQIECDSTSPAERLGEKAEFRPACSLEGAGSDNLAPGDQRSLRPDEARQLPGSPRNGETAPWRRPLTGSARRRYIVR